MNLTCSFYGLSYMNTTGFAINAKACAFVSIMLSLPTSLLNTSLIIVLLQPKERSKPSNVFLLNLVITDCLCGYITQPCLFFILHKLSVGEDPCAFALGIMPISYILGMASFLAITSIALERYMAIFHPFFYERALNFRTVIITVITIWLFSTMTVIHPVVKKENKVVIGLVITGGVIGTNVNIYCYYKILTFTRRVRNEISSTTHRYWHQDAEKRQRESSLAFTGGLIMISMCVCCVPYIIVSALEAFGLNFSVLEYLRYWTWNLANGNSLLNACITCYQLSHLRQAIYVMWTCKRSRDARVSYVNQPAVMDKCKTTTTSKRTEDMNIIHIE